MNDETIVVERVYDAPIAMIWKAITDKNEMKKWYFPLAEFKPEKGFKFQFTGGEEGGKQYLHLCEVTEVIPEKKLTYSWKYDGLPGNSFVTFELQPKGNKTLLTLTHEGVASFAANGPDFAKHNFEGGWSYFMNEALLNYLSPVAKA